MITGVCEDWQSRVTLRAHDAFERAVARGWFDRIATQAGVSWALLQCKEDSMAGLVPCRWFYLADIVHMRCRNAP